VPRLPDGYNPATWMLEVCGGGAKMYVAAVEGVDFHAVYTASPLAARTAAAANATAAADAAANTPLALSSRFAVPPARQLVLLTWKLSLVYWRSPGYNLGRLAGAVVTGLVFGATFHGMGRLPRDRAARIADVQGVLGAVYGGLAFMGMTSLIMGASLSLVPIKLSTPMYTKENSTRFLLVLRAAG